MFEKWETGAGVTIKRNPNYWDAQHMPNYPNKILFKTINDNAAALVAAKIKKLMLCM
jgi:ABC-type transport system substrate-binding protein